MVRPNPRFKGHHYGQSLDSVTYSQHSESQEWIIDHWLNRYPVVTIIDASTNSQIWGEVQYEGLNRVRIRFSKPVRGTAILT